MKFKSMHKKIRDKILPLRISSKITFAYSIIIILTILGSALIFRQISLYSARKKVSEVSTQTLYSIKTGVDIIFNDVNNYSKLIFSDNKLQDLLRGGNMYSDLNEQSEVSKYLYNMLHTTSLIDSVIICDKAGNSYSVGKKIQPTLLISEVEEASWFERVIKNKGSYLLSLNADDAFSIHQEGNFISLIRQIRDVDTSEELGILAINILEDTIHQSYASVIDEANTYLVIVDEGGRSIVQDGVDYLNDMKEVIGLESAENNSGFITYQRKNTRYLVSYIADEDRGWGYFSIMPFGNVQYENTWLMLITVVILIINGSILFVSSIVLSKRITMPINMLLEEIQRVEKGEFKPISIKAKDYEFKKLFVGYNFMISEIEQLIKRVIRERDTIRKTELNALQAQIKPHFLYNTLDSVLSLAISGDMKAVCKLIEALESYYKLSVNKGKEVVIIGEEISLVENYLIIQKIRYPELFDVSYEIDESCLNISMLKLVLQPLVENALYHGIRPKEERGHIKIRVKREAGSVVLSVIDDGVGMSEETVNAIFKCSKTKNESFGLWGTVERICIYYNCKDCVKLESTLYRGTKIDIIVKEKGLERTIESNSCR